MLNIGIELRTKIHFMMNLHKKTNCIYISLLVLSLFISRYTVAQSNAPNLDSASLYSDISSFKNDSLLAELRSLLDSMNKPISFFSFYTSVSNRLYSTKNNAFNAQQYSNSNMAVSPSISYYHKTGLGISATSYLSTVEGKFSLYQTALSPSFDKINKKIMYGVSYSYYIKKMSAVSTPYEHEVYAYVQGRKKWLRPSLAFGWAEGEYKDVSTIPIKINGNYRWISDTSKVTLNDLSLIAGLSHSFVFNHIITRKDALTFVPQVNIIGGMQSFGIISTMQVPDRPEREINDDRIRKIYRIRTNANSTTSQVSLQTIALSANLTYIKDAISVSTGYFLGYYLNNTSGNRLSHIFNVSVGLTF
jgi:hypothetical protein